MATYKAEWRDLKLPSGQQFSIGICGRSNTVYYMTYGLDPLKKLFQSEILFDANTECSKGNSCLDKSCPFNKTTNATIAEMFDVNEDDEVDEETQKQWDAKTIVDCYVKMAAQISKELQMEQKTDKEE